MNDADVALSAVMDGAAVVGGLFGTAVERFDKGGGDFATSADVRAEAAMLAVLRRERPGDSIWGEESGTSGAIGSVRRWLIDPLCGTRNYAAGMQVVAVNAALSTPQGVLAAAVADPFAGTAVWADGAAAWVRNESGDVLAVPSADSCLVDLNFDPPFPNAEAFRAVNLAADPEFARRFRPRVVSSTLAVAWVATGQRAGYVTDGDLRDSVHFAAGVAVCQTAGCIVTDLWGGPVGTSADGLIIGADAATHVALLELVATQRV